MSGTCRRADRRGHYELAASSARSVGILLAVIVAASGVAGCDKKTTNKPAEPRVTQVKPEDQESAEPAPETQVDEGTLPGKSAANLQRGDVRLADWSIRDAQDQVVEQATEVLRYDDPRGVIVSGDQLQGEKRLRSQREFDGDFSLRLQLVTSSDKPSDQSQVSLLVQQGFSNSRPAMVSEYALPGVFAQPRLHEIEIRRSGSQLEVLVNGEAQPSSDAFPQSRATLAIRVSQDATLWIHDYRFQGQTYQVARLDAQDWVPLSGDVKDLDTVIDGVALRPAAEGILVARGGWPRPVDLVLRPTLGDFEMMMAIQLPPREQQSALRSVIPSIGIRTPGNRHKSLSHSALDSDVHGREVILQLTRRGREVNLLIDGQPNRGRPTNRQDFEDCHVYLNLAAGAHFWITELKWTDLSQNPRERGVLEQEAVRVTRPEKDTVFDLPADLHEVALGGGGQYLLLRCDNEQLLVFDVGQRQLANTLPIKPTALVTATRDRILVLDKQSGRLERWSLPDLQRQQEVSLPEPETISQLLAGADSDGPVYVCRRVNTASRIERFDLETLELLSSHDTGRAFTRWKVNVSGNTVTAHPTQPQERQRGGHRIRWTNNRPGYQWTPKSTHLMADSTAEILLGQVTETAANESSIRALVNDPSLTLPATQGTYLLQVDMFQGVPWNLSVGVVRQPKLRFPLGQFAMGPRPDTPLIGVDERFVLVPQHDALAVLPFSNRRVVVRRLGLDDMLGAREDDYVLVTSNPPGTLQAGQEMSYPLSVKSNAPITYHLGQPPPGATITDDGTVKWRAPVQSPRGVRFLVQMEDDKRRRVPYPFYVEVLPQPGAEPVTTAGKAAEKPKDDGFRQWSQRTGDGKIEAKLIAFEAPDTIKLEQRDGKVVETTLSRFIDDDVQYVRREALRRGKPGGFSEKKSDDSG